MGLIILSLVFFVLFLIYFISFIDNYKNYIPHWPTFVSTLAQDFSIQIKGINEQNFSEKIKEFLKNEEKIKEFYLYMRDYFKIIMIRELILATFFLFLSVSFIFSYYKLRTNYTNFEKYIKTDTLMDYQTNCRKVSKYTCYDIPFDFDKCIDEEIIEIKCF